MKKLFLHINAFLVLMFFVANLQAQNPSSVKEFDALWEKTAQGNGKTGNVTKDLNALEREKIKSIDDGNTHNHIVPVHKRIEPPLIIFFTQDAAHPAEK